MQKTFINSAEMVMLGPVATRQRHARRTGHLREARECAERTAIKEERRTPRGGVVILQSPYAPSRMAAALCMYVHAALRACSMPAGMVGPDQAART